MNSKLSILARMTAKDEAPVVDVPLTSSRALRVAMTREVVLLFRPVCSLAKVDQGFISGC